MLENLRENLGKNPEGSRGNTKEIGGSPEIFREIRRNQILSTFRILKTEFQKLTNFRCSLIRFDSEINCSFSNSVYSGLLSRLTHKRPYKTNSLYISRAFGKQRK